MIVIAVVFLFGAFALLPEGKYWRAAGAFLLGVSLFLVRESIFSYAAKGGVFLEHVTPLVYLSVVFALLVFAGIYLLKNVRLPRS